jgi:PPOX class probable F420-dependent enzyme
MSGRSPYSPARRENVAAFGTAATRTSSSPTSSRIRNDASVQIAPSTRRSRPLGPIAAATARILSVTEQREAQTVTDREFGWLKRLFGLIWRLQGREQAYIEIRPTEE